MIQCLPINEDPKTPCKETQENISPNLHGTVNTNTNSLIEPYTSRQYLPPESFSQESGMVIPSPFKRALFWPTPKENSKKRMKEKVPSVITSIEWQRYYENKERKKAVLEEEKKRRAEERKKKKEETEEARKLKTDNKLDKKRQKTLKKKSKKTDYNSSTEEEWVESGDSIDDISDEFGNDENECLEQESIIKQSDYVIVNFPGKKKYHKYVCIIQKVTKPDIEVMAMVACDESKTLFKENDKDISIISESQIIQVLDVPKMIITGDRIKYKFDKSLEVDG